ncbi:uncharacterized protein LOC118489139 [Helianthus annuus]|uniref:uncharacterized protein LOC118489139 n=1 Tax=Helianthus annuus TaxID=4232 RepID=UPI00165309C3|nr:uncharacterized protein LOC118489139 [Helianthus annuus]
MIHINVELIHSLTCEPNRNVAVMAKRMSKTGPVVAEWKGKVSRIAWITRLGVKPYFDDILPQMHDYGRNFSLNFLVAFFTIIGHLALVNDACERSRLDRIEGYLIEWVIVRVLEMLEETLVKRIYGGELKRHDGKAQKKTTVWKVKKP